MSYFKIFYKGTVSEHKIFFKDEACTIVHREDGPAIEFADGSGTYFLNNIYYNETIYWKKIAKIKFGDFV